MAKKLRLLLVFGGCSSEYPVSLESAYSVITHLNQEKYEMVLLGITRKGAWRLFTGDTEDIPTDTWERGSVPCTLSLDRGCGQLLVEREGKIEKIPFDAAFPVLHGKNGEDGTVQGLLELIGVPVVGCGTLASALCMDKDRAHALASLAGIRVPRSAVFGRGEAMEAFYRAAEELGYPVFVKPVRAGSSFGISRVERPAALCQAVAEAFAHDDSVMIEEAIPGFEVGCAVMGRGRELTVGAVDEVELASGFFDYEEKYNLITSSIHVPARITPEQTAAVCAAARTVYAALGCSVLARVDFFLTPAGEIVFNEVNTIPGFTAHSRYPSMMAAAGMPFGELLDRLIDLAVKA